MNAGHKRIKSILSSNKKVMENYFFMTILQVLNSLFYLIIYPFLIHTLGSEGYGLYVFAFSIVTYFMALISFGFDMPAVKHIAQNIHNNAEKERILSGVFTAKIYLMIFSFILFVPLVFSIPSLRINWIIYFICFSQILIQIIFPQWYFQGIQKMRIVTYIQLGFKLLSLPFIFIFIHQSDDVWIFATIVSASSLIGAYVAALIIRYKDGLIIRWSKFKDVIHYFREALPFFASNSMNVVKQQSAVVILGSFFSMNDVAFYDLAVKIYTVPMVLISSINNALYPKIVMLKDFAASVKKILKLENIIGVGIILFLAVVGKWIIQIMGGHHMLASYPLLIIISFSVFGQLTVGAIGSFLFIPLNKSRYIASNQLVAFVSFFLFVVLGIWLQHEIYVVPLALTLSVFCELIYSYYIVRKEKML